MELLIALIIISLWYIHLTYLFAVTDAQISSPMMIVLIAIIKLHKFKPQKI